LGGPATRGIAALVLYGWLLGFGTLALGAAPSGGARIGYLGTHSTWTKFFLEELRNLGYVEGQNLNVAWRIVDEDFERLPKLAAELVALHVDLIFVDSTLAARAAHNATTTIPIVLTEVSDPVGSGFAASLARPGGNITGVTNMTPDIAAKRLEILREALPKRSKAFIVWNPSHPAGKVQLAATEAAAARLGIKAQGVPISAAAEVRSAFAQITNDRTSLLLITDDTLLWNLHGELASAAVDRGLPAMGGMRAFADAGGLIAYGPSIREQFRRAATYVDKVLNGANPAELPIERPTQFELVVNVRTAKALGLSMPESVLVRADEVVR
jgi:putative ABC transport system substrate-binding protein